MLPSYLQVRESLGQKAPLTGIMGLITVSHGQVSHELSALGFIHDDLPAPYGIKVHSEPVILSRLLSFFPLFSEADYSPPTQTLTLYGVNMKKVLGLVMLMTVSFANAADVKVKEVSADFLNGARVGAKIAVVRGEAGVKITTITKERKVTPRQITIVTKKTEFVTVPELQVVGNKVMLEDVICGKIVTKQNPGPRNTGYKKVLKLSGACKMGYDADPGSVLISIVTE